MTLNGMNMPKRSIDFLQGVFETQLDTARSASLGAAGTGLHLVARLCRDINESATFLEAEPTDQDFSGSLRVVSVTYPDGDPLLGPDGEDATDLLFDLLFEPLSVLDDSNQDEWLPFTAGDKDIGGQVVFDLSAILDAYDNI